MCCSTTVGSVMRSLQNHDLREFCWKKLNEEMTTHAPLLTYILQSCLNTKTPRDNTPFSGGWVWLRQTTYYSYYFDYLLSLRFKGPCRTLGIYFR